MSWCGQRVAKRVSVGKAVWWAQGRQVVGARKADGGRRVADVGRRKADGGRRDGGLVQSHSFFGRGLDTTIDQKRKNENQNSTKEMRKGRRGQGGEGGLSGG